MFRCFMCDRAFDFSGRELDALELAFRALAGELDEGYIYIACDGCLDAMVEIAFVGMEESDER
jgi:hypothetical protein